MIGASPAYTSADCSACGARVNKSLSVRTHICPCCGVVLDRDHNAAINILEKALEEYFRTVGQTETAPSESGDNASGQTASTRCRRKSKTGKRAG